MEEVQVTLTPESAGRIHALYEIAKDNGSLISIEDVLPLMKEGTSKAELMEAMMTIPSLSSRFDLTSGYVTEKRHPDEIPQSISVEFRSREKARTNLRFAEKFAPFLDSGDLKLIAVSGSTSYRSASRSSDLDLFCVAKQATLWIALTKSLVLAKVFRLANRDSPSICMSCVMDEQFAYSMFAQKRDPLFARDALETVLLRDDGVYAILLKRAHWISGVYPSLYSMRLNASARSRKSTSTRSLIRAVVNRFLFFATGSFIRVKSSLLRRRLMKEGRFGDVFTLLIGVDHLIYESDRYVQMRRTYGNINTSRAIELHIED
jgi:hypothetical protein